MTECPAHPGVEAVDTCARCGRFYCAAEEVQLDLSFYCGDCGVREDVDWLGHHYRRLEGKRSGFAWFMLALGLVLVAGGVLVLITPGAPWTDVLIGLGMVIYGAAAAAFFSGRPRARPALLIGNFAAAAAFIMGCTDFWGVIPTSVVFGLTGAAWTDVRSKLFYRQPVSRGKLYAHFEREGSNPLAVLASRLSLLAFFVPGMSFVTLVLGAIAISRIDSKARPPVGNLSAALAAIVVSALMSVVWVVAFWSSLGP